MLSMRRAEARLSIGRGNVDKPKTLPRVFSPQARDGEQQLKIRSGSPVHVRLLGDFFQFVIAGVGKVQAGRPA